MKNNAYLIDIVTSCPERRNVTRCRAPADRRPVSAPGVTRTVPAGFCRKLRIPEGNVTVEYMI